MVFFFFFGSFAIFLAGFERKLQILSRGPDNLIFIGRKSRSHLSIFGHFRRRFCGHFSCALGRQRAGYGECCGTVCRPSVCSFVVVEYVWLLPTMIF